MTSAPRCRQRQGDSPASPRVHGPSTPRRKKVSTAPTVPSLLLSALSSIARRNILVQRRRIEFGRRRDQDEHRHSMDVSAAIRRTISSIDRDARRRLAGDRDCLQRGSEHVDHLDTGLPPPHRLGRALRRCGRRRQRHQSVQLASDRWPLSICGGAKLSTVAPFGNGGAAPMHASLRAPPPPGRCIQMDLPRPSLRASSLTVSSVRRSGITRPGRNRASTTSPRVSRLRRPIRGIGEIARAKRGA